jgi:hypothetical protein
VVNAIDKYFYLRIIYIRESKSYKDTVIYTISTHRNAQWCICAMCPGSRFQLDEKEINERKASPKRTKPFLKRENVMSDT